MAFYARLGQRLREFRIRAGLSQAALGARLDRSASAIDRYEMGQRRISIADLHRLAGILGVPLERFFEDRRAGRVGTRVPAGDGRGTLTQPPMDRLRAEYRLLLRELDRRLSEASPQRRQETVHEVPRPYRGSRRPAGTALSFDAYAASLSPGRLRSWARRAGWHGDANPEMLRRYAALVLDDFVRRQGGSVPPRRRIEPKSRRIRGTGLDLAGDPAKSTTPRTPSRQEAR
jgi:transcriptional regulator with XRE-family HTH domain